MACSLELSKIGLVPPSTAGKSTSSLADDAANDDEELHLEEDL